MITDLLLKTRELYQATYPERTKHLLHQYMNCTVTDPETKETMVDSGVCYIVARAVFNKLKETGLNPNLFFLWRHYSSPAGNGFEDELVHVGVELDGRFYDTVNTEGVPEAFQLWAAGYMRCSEWTLIDNDGSQYFSRIMSRDTPYFRALSEL